MMFLTEMAARMDAQGISDRSGAAIIISVIGLTLSTIHGAAAGDSPRAQQHHAMVTAAGGAHEPSGNETGEGRF